MSLLCAVRRGLPVLVGALILALSGAAPALAAPQPIGFAADVTYPAGNSPDAVVSGDFNGDGHLDLAVPNYDTDNTQSTVAVLSGLGDGRFAPAVDYPVGHNPVGITTGDFNGDGYPDLAVANFGSSSVSILVGHADGTFSTHTIDLGTADNPVYPQAIVAADLNGDGRPDLALTDSLNSSVTVLINHGDGTFAAPVAYAVGNGPTGIAVGDFNRDGQPDLAVVNQTDGTVSLLLGSGGGTFVPGATVTVGTGPAALVSGDFNGDGSPDLAVANRGSGADDSGGDVAVLLGNGLGGFAAPVDYPAGTGPDAIVGGDLNGDGITDLAVTDVDGNTVSTLAGNGDGTFGTATSSDVGVNPAAAALGDFNGDGARDLATVDEGAAQVSVLLNAPTADANPGSLTFGSAGSPEPQGLTSTAQTVTITNHGSAPLSVSGFAFGGSDPADFRVTSDTCGGPVAPGANCAAEIAFSPQGTGSRSASLSVLSNASDPSSITLTGTAGALNTGSQGPAGAMGPAGQTGPQGAPGPQGASGATGATGATGPAGPAGDAGATGPAGATGSHGAPGDPGAAGAPGAPGAAGAMGPAGPTGPRGHTGPRGAAGRSSTLLITIRCVTTSEAAPERVRCTVNRTGPGVVHARLMRGSAIVATGVSRRGRLVLSGRRRLRRGSYTLVLTRRGRHGRTIVSRSALRIR